MSFQYDSSGVWVEKSITVAQVKHTVKLPIIPRRCDHMRIKIAGKGSCRIFSITKTIEEGSDV